ncbi:MAG: hypothetical protein WCQ50_02925 [Spirochaetota bacterium]
MEPSGYLSLLSDLEGEFSFFQKNRDRVIKAKERVDLDRGDVLLSSGFAFLLHNLYTGYEAYFLRISKFFENGLPADEWHKFLVDRMSWKVEELRPAFLLEEDRIAFHELRAFRHLFRHLYDRDLDPERVFQVFPYAAYTIRVFPERHAAFCGAIRTMARRSSEVK